MLKVQRASLCAIALLLSTGLLVGQTKLLGIGDKLSRRDIPDTPSRHLCMTHPAQIDPCFEKVLDGVRYTIAFNMDSRRVSYLFTNDSLFKTGDGKKVGDVIEISASEMR